MPEIQQRKRETAYKIRIGDILRGTPIIEDIIQEASTDPSQIVEQRARERFRFLELGDKKIYRINVIANIIEKYQSEGEKRYASITIDDGTGQIRLKVFGDDVNKFEGLQEGDTIIIIGILRTYNQELYILPEIIKRADVKYLFIRKLELDKNEKKFIQENQVQPTEKKLETRDQIIEIIKSGEATGGASTEDIILKIKSASPEIINSEIIKLIEDGLAYEPRPGKVRWLG
jgi:RPA family protein